MSGAIILPGQEAAPITLLRLQALKSQYASNADVLVLIDEIVKLRNAFLEAASRNMFAINALQNPGVRPPAELIAMLDKQLFPAG